MTRGHSSLSSRGSSANVRLSRYTDPMAFKRGLMEDHGRWVSSNSRFDELISDLMISGRNCDYVDQIGKTCFWQLSSVPKTRLPLRIWTE